MKDFILYSLETTICLSIFYIFYFFALRKETNHNFVRRYLLLSAITSFLIPLIDFGFIQQESNPIIPTIYLPEMMAIGNSPSPATESLKTSDYHNFLWPAFYGTVSFLFFVWFTQELFKILELRKNSSREDFPGYRVFTHNTNLPTFSFFKDIYLSKKDLTSGTKKENILLHEIAHVRGFHSSDILFMEILKIIFWFNPLVYFYRNALALSHEYIADEQSVIRGNDQSYVNLLVNQTLSNLGLSLGSHFGRKSGILPEWFPLGQVSINKSITLKRIKMIKNKKKMSKLKFMVPAFALLLAFVVASCLENEELTEEIIEQEVAAVDDIEKVEVSKDRKVTIYYKNGEIVETTADQIKEEVEFETLKIKDSYLSDVDGEVFTIVEQRPEYIGGNTAMYQFLSQNIQYPSNAKNNGVQGRVMVEFIVNEDGAISHARVLKGIDPDCDEEALRVVKEMPSWTPGQQRGKNVKVRMVMPILFKIAGAEEADLKSKKLMLEKALKATQEAVKEELVVVGHQKN